MSTRRLLVRNLPANITKERINGRCAEFGSVREVYIPTDPVSRRPRGFAFVEFNKVADAERCLEALNNTNFDGSVLHVVFVEPKDQQERRPSNFEDDHQDRRVRGPREPALSHLPQPPPVAPPPPMNPNTETYRYNTMAGEFIIDSSGRLTRRRDDYISTDRARSRSRSPMLGIGGGLLKAVRVNDDRREVVEAEEEYPVIAEVKFSSLLPSQVIDFSDI